jgi:uncharacterized protein YecE (DUF72 family)
VKASRFITHIKRLRDIEEPVQRFFNSVSALESKLGVVLFQLPPSLAFEKGLLEGLKAAILKAFETNTESESDTSKASSLQAVRCAIEPRHKSWMEDEALACLHDLGFGFCISDTGGRYPYREAVTADFAYIRLHGPTSLYSSWYTNEELKQWAGKIAALDCDAYVYFDNTVMAYASDNALTLRALLER